MSYYIGIYFDLDRGKWDYFMTATANEIPASAKNIRVVKSKKDAEIQCDVLNRLLLNKVNGKPQ